MKKRKRLVFFLLCGCCLFPFAAAEGISIGEELVQAEEQEHLDEFSEMRDSECTKANRWCTSLCYEHRQ